MGKGKKTLCCWKKEEIKEDLDKLRDLVRNPRFVCRKCGRAARDEDSLCKPAKL